MNTHLELWKTRKINLEPWIYYADEASVCPVLSSSNFFHDRWRMTKQVRSNPSWGIGPSVYDNDDGDDDDSSLSLPFHTPLIQLGGESW